MSPIEQIGRAVQASGHYSREEDMLAAGFSLATVYSIASMIVPVKSEETEGAISVAPTVPMIALFR